jgi:hypothetical protein
LYPPLLLLLLLLLLLHLRPLCTDNNRFPDIPYDVDAEVAAYEKYAEQLRPFITGELTVTIMCYITLVV